MTRIVTNHEMSRRQAMAAAQCDLTDAMMKHSLTPLEWSNVLADCQLRMIWHGLKEEFRDENKDN